MRAGIRLAGLTVGLGLLLTACGSEAPGTALIEQVRSNAPSSTSSSSTSSPSSTSSSPTTSSSKLPSSSSSSSSSSTSRTTTSDDPTTDETSSGSDADEDTAGLAAFGEMFPYENGLDVTISAPVPFTPSEYASADPAPAYLGFTVTVVNNSGETYDPSSFRTSLQSGSTEATEVYDSEGGFSGAPSAGILDGRDLSFTLGFGVTDAEDLVMQVNPGSEYKDAYFLTEAATSAVVDVPAANNTGGDDQAKFGEIYAWEDGLVVSVSAPAAFTPSEYASVEESAAYLSFTITVVNDTGAIFDPSLFSINGQSGSVEADEVYDSASGFFGSPRTGLLPGRQFTFTVGFGVSDPADVVLEIRPGFDYEEAYFTS